MLTKARNRSLTTLIFLFISLFGCLTAQQVTFRAFAPKSVVKGQEFRLTFALENAPDEGKIDFPSSIKGFDILYGPALASKASTDIVINGKRSSSTSLSYRYTLTATTEGIFTIPSATINVNGKTYTSNSLQIKVLPLDKQAQAQQSQQNQRAQDPVKSTSTTSGFNPSDAFIRAVASKTRVYEQEALVVTYRMYRAVEYRDMGKIEFPEFNGFMVEEQELSRNRQWTVEHFNGRNYFAIDLRRILLFPQHAGTITIPQGKIQMLFSVESGKVINTPFGRQQMRQDVERILTTPSLNINVTALPTSDKPAGFSNAVGNFSITSTISDTDIKANDGVTIKLVISGTGNAKLIKTPELKLPQDFEAYDPKITNDLHFTDNGLSGTKTIEYFFIPRYEGTYKIEPIELSYFDLKSKSYKTLKTKEYTLNVAKDPNVGSNSSTSFTQTDLQVDNDIRHIKTEKLSPVKIGDFFMGSVGYYLWYIIPALIFVIFFLFNRKRIKENSDIAKTKTKRANKVATKRLKQSLVYLNAKQNEKFYEEVLRATWGYLSDKLLIPVAELSRDNIELELSKYGADAELTKKFMHILDTCEFARYAPVESNTAMSDLYELTDGSIEEMENTKRKVVKKEATDKSSKYR